MARRQRTVDAVKARQELAAPSTDSANEEAEIAGTFGDEARWGNPHHSQPRENFSSGEVRIALVWLSIAALIALVIEVVFLGVRVTVGGLAIPCPWTIPLAYVVNLIIINTSLLWTRNRKLAVVPVAVWTAGYGALLLWAAVPGGGDLAMGQWLRTILLLAAGVFGGVWPLRHLRP